MSVKPVKREKCGTVAGYQTHMRRGEVTCSECRDAQRAYVRAWRRNNADVRERELQLRMARERAWKRLADMRPSEYRALYDEECSDLPARTYKRREVNA